MAQLLAVGFCTSPNVTVSTCGTLAKATVGWTDSTAGDSWKAESTPGDSWGPFWPPSCRRGVSLGRRLSPARQSGRRVVADTSVWRAGCRRGVSLAGGASQTQPLATAGRQNPLAATAGARFGPLPVAGGGQSGRLAVAGASVWLAGCRQRHSLLCAVSPEAQSDAWAVAGGTVWPAGTDKLDGRRQQETRFHPRRQLGPDFAPFLSPARQSEQLAVAGASVWAAGCRRYVSLVLCLLIATAPGVMSAYCDDFGLV